MNGRDDIESKVFTPFSKSMARLKPGTFRSEDESAMHRATETPASSLDIVVSSQSLFFYFIS